uniref:Uncharacterized protein n=1 Tax=Romanomermis culicivorax TaxID=13658 RepID=A0A915HV55_ROMCU
MKPTIEEHPTVVQIWHTCEVSTARISLDTVTLRIKILFVQTKLGNNPASGRPVRHTPKNGPDCLSGADV